MQNIKDFDVRELMMVHDNYKKYENVPSNLVYCAKEKNEYSFSIVIPTYKRVDTLRDTVNSCLRQEGFQDYNIIIVDNNPERGDETELYIVELNNPKIKYYKNSANIGMTGNWNRCIELCEGEYAILLHDDDMLSPDYLYSVSNVISKHHEVDVLYVGIKSWHQDDNESIPKLNDDKKRHNLYKASVINCLFTYSHAPTGMVLKKDSNLNIGGFDERTYPSADYYYYTYAAENGLNVYTYTKPLIIYRVFINDSLNEKTKLNFIVRSVLLHCWLLDKLNIPNFVRKWMLSVKIDTVLISCKPETIKQSSNYNITYSKILLINNRIFKKCLAKYYNMRIALLKKYIYRRSSAIDYI